VACSSTEDFTVNRQRSLSHKRAAAGRVKSPAKRRAAAQRWQLSQLRALTNFLRTHPDALDSPSIAPAVEELTQLLVMHMVIKLGLAPEAVR
jgi:hypothetical protein